MRRLFSRWLALARLSRRRRRMLKEKEDELRHSMLAYTWDKWRDRFNDEKLRPIVSYVYVPNLELMIRQEHAVIIQTQRNALFRAFGLWHSKTKVQFGALFHLPILTSVMPVSSCNTISRNAQQS